MQHAQFVSHVDTDLVSRAELRALPAPEVTTFKPIPHIELVDMLDAVLQQNQIRIEEERFALPRDGSVLSSCSSPMARLRTAARPWGSAPRTTRPCPSSSVRGSPYLSATTSRSVAT